MYFSTLLWISRQLQRWDSVLLGLLSEILLSTVIQSVFSVMLSTWQPYLGQKWEKALPPFFYKRRHMVLEKYSKLVFSTVLSFSVFFMFYCCPWYKYAIALLPMVFFILSLLLSFSEAKIMPVLHFYLLYALYLLYYTRLNLKYYTRLSIFFFLCSVALAVWNQRLSPLWVNALQFSFESCFPAARTWNLLLIIETNFSLWDF